MIEEKMKIVRMVEEKQKEEEDLIEIRMVKEMVPGRFYKYLKVFEKKGIRENANEKDLESCYRSQERFCSKKEEDISIVKNREGGGAEVCKGSVKEEVYLTIEITTNVTSILCAKEGWKKEASAGL